MKAIIFSDGGSRGNPGLAAIGYTIKSQISDEGVIYECGMPIGKTTNNIAEYTAVIEAIRKAKEMGFDDLEVFLDSQLVERQVKGQYKVKSQDLMPLFENLIELISTLSSFKISHVKRELNKRADKLLNDALDKDEIIIFNHKEENILLPSPIDKLRNFLEEKKIKIEEIKPVKNILIIIVNKKEVKKIVEYIDDINLIAKGTNYNKVLYDIK